jgi:uncharacterized protein (TIGR02145 family)
MRIKNLFVVLSILIVNLVAFTACDPNGLNPVGGNGSIKDYDGNVYDSVVIGNQVWMVQNLRVTHYRNGDKIPMLSNDKDWESSSNGAWCNYINQGSNSKDYGRLYNQTAVLDSRGIAPQGWRVATYNDWLTLRTFLIKHGYNYNSDTVSNKIAISLAGKTKWEVFSGEGLVGNDLASNNKSGFNALPGGARDYTGSFGGGKRNGYWWTSSSVNASGFMASLSYDKDSLNINFEPMRCGFSVRCIRDTKSY